MDLTFSAVIEKFEDKNKLYLVHVKVPQNIYEQFSAKMIKRVVVSFDGSSLVHNAFLTDKNKGKYIKMAKEIMKEKSLAIGQKIEVHIAEDTSKYGMPIAPEMEELLQQDIEGEVFFHKLTPGKIRSLLFKINGYKSSNKRIEKSIIILEHLKANDGALDWKMLNQAWKDGLG